MLRHQLSFGGKFPSTSTRTHSVEILEAIAKDRKDGDFCDLEIVCDKKCFPAHRNVVCLRSPVIRAACLGPWKEAACGVFEIKESSPLLVRRMLDYIYTGDYDDFDNNTLALKDDLSLQGIAELGVETAGHVTMHAKMMELGNMYLVDGLSTLASEKFVKYLTSADTLTRAIIINVIPQVYALKFDPSNVIRKSVIKHIRTKMTQRPWAADVEEHLEHVTRDVPEFTRDLLKSYMCDDCKKNRNVAAGGYGGTYSSHSPRTKRLQAFNLPP
ncbi:hypothetical protein E4U56_007586 [Claviceps arundinis]|uniref:BTB domain-containing protein n=1 Tax=Claviceps arundinis TaxID=1623583 RepID=A0A9P7SRX9_9HYPO|nr:hypothetical protein E4U56_007586 [Claviceps arundinis]